MPYEITHEDGLLRIRFFGNLTGESFGNLARDMARLEQELPVTPHRIIDLRDSEGVNLNFRSILTVGQFRTIAALHNPVKSAMIAPDPILYGFARMFQMLIANPSITVAIFPAEESALAWLCEPGLAPPAKPWSPGG